MSGPGADERTWREANLVQLEHRWQQLLWSFHIERRRALAIFSDLVAAYGSPGRFYHTLEHIQAVLDWTDRLAVYARHLPVIALSAWLHDSVYDTHREDNEERSAAYAEELLNRLGIRQQIRCFASSTCSCALHQCRAAAGTLTQPSSGWSSLADYWRGKWSIGSSLSSRLGA